MNDDDDDALVAVIQFVRVIDDGRGCCIMHKYEHIQTVKSISITIKKNNQKVNFDHDLLIALSNA